MNDIKRVRLLARSKDAREFVTDAGFPTTMEGWEAFLTWALTTTSLNQLARELETTPATLRVWMKRFGIKNPNKPGGANNPKGFRGNKKARINRDKGVE